MHHCCAISLIVRGGGDCGAMRAVLELERARAILEKFFAGQPTFDWSKVIVASSHGEVRKSRKDARGRKGRTPETDENTPPGQLGEQRDRDVYHKLSFRIIVPGFKMTMSAMKQRLAEVDPRGVFDRSPYMKTQKLRVVGAHKTPEDRRVMDLHGQLPTREAMGLSLVQVVGEEDVHLQFGGTGKRRRPLGDVNSRAFTDEEVAFISSSLYLWTEGVWR